MELCLLLNNLKTHFPQKKHNDTMMSKLSTAEVQHDPFFDEMICAFLDQRAEGQKKVNTGEEILASSKSNPSSLSEGWR